MIRNWPVVAGHPTGVRPDAVTEDHVVLIKGCSFLRLTHQIRLATAMAMSLEKRLLLIVRQGCELDPALQGFIVDHGALIEVRQA